MLVCVCILQTCINDYIITYTANQTMPWFSFSRILPNLQHHNLFSTFFVISVPFVWACACTSSLWHFLKTLRVISHAELSFLCSLSQSTCQGRLLCRRVYAIRDGLYYECIYTRQQQWFKTNIQLPLMYVLCNSRTIIDVSSNSKCYLHCYEKHAIGTRLRRFTCTLWNQNYEMPPGKDLFVSPIPTLLECAKVREPTRRKVQRWNNYTYISFCKQHINRL